MNILHIAPSNVAGVPYEFYRMHLECGDNSRLVTIHNIEPNFKEDICLNFPIFNFNVIKNRRKKYVAFREEEYKKELSARYYSPRSAAENIYFFLNDALRTPVVNAARKKYSLDEYDIIHYDGGIDFYRFPKLALQWKQQGKKIVCCYYGSDLRIRGLIKELDAISNLNLTSEYDHLALKPDLKYLFYPYDMNEVPERIENKTEIVRIVHSPTNRLYKGTELILKVIEDISKVRKIHFDLLERVPRTEVLAAKSRADIIIDQVGGKMGGTGYGRSGIEALAMGIPVITNMTKEYNDWLPENPFCVANNEEELRSLLLSLIDNPDKRSAAGKAGKQWVSRYHSYASVNRRLYDYYKEAGII